MDENEIEVQVGRPCVVRRREGYWAAEAAVVLGGEGDMLKCLVHATGSEVMASPADDEWLLGLVPGPVVFTLDAHWDLCRRRVIEQEHLDRMLAARSGGDPATPVQILVRQGMREERAVLLADRLTAPEPAVGESDASSVSSSPPEPAVE